MAQWLLPATLFVVAAAGFAIIYAPHPDWRVEVVGVLAVGALWLSALVFGPLAVPRPGARSGARRVKADEARGAAVRE